MTTGWWLGVTPLWLSKPPCHVNPGLMIGKGANPTGGGGDYCVSQCWSINSLMFSIVHPIVESTKHGEPPNYPNPESIPIHGYPWWLWPITTWVCPKTLPLVIHWLYNNHHVPDPSADIWGMAHFETNPNVSWFDTVWPTSFRVNIRWVI